MGISINGGTLKWLVFVREHPIKIDDLGVPHFRKTPTSIVCGDIFIVNRDISIVSLDISIVSGDILIVNGDRWRFPEIGVPPVIIHL